MGSGRSTGRKVSAFVARFVVTFFLTGSIKFGAVLYESVSSSDGFTKASTGLLFILPYAVARLLGPGVNMLMKYFGARALSSFGGFIFGAGYICSGLCDLKPQYMFSFFTVSGIGLACMLLPTVLCLRDAFDDGIRLVMPLAMLGSYAGITVIPLVAVYVNQEYGTSAALLLFGAISWNLVPCAFALSDGRGPRDSRRSESGEVRGEEMTQLLENPSESERENSDDSNESTRENKKNPARNKIYRAFHDFWKFANLNFCLFFVIANFRKIPNDAWTLYLIPRVESSWMTATAAARVGSMGGVGGVLGRLVAAASFKTRSLTPVLLYSIYFIANGVIFVGMEAFVYPAGLTWPKYVASFMNGLLLSAQSGMVAGILHLLVSEKNFLAAYAVIDLGNGILALLAGFGPGFLFDVYGDYGITFTLIGIISLLCGLLAILIWFSGLWKIRRTAGISSS